MGRIDLQLFALKLNTDTSIVDYLKSQGQDSSYNSRKKLANQYGISNYTGTASQNTNLLKMLKNSSASSTTGNSTGSNKAGTGTVAAANKNNDKNNKKGNKNKDIVAPSNDAVAAANSVLDGTVTGGAGAVIANGGLGNVVNPIEETVVVTPQTAKETAPAFTPTATPTYTPQQYTAPTFNQVQTPTYTGQTTQANQATTLDQRLPADTLAALNSQFQVSQAYQQAMDYTNSLLQQLSGGKTSYSDQISRLISDYQNRDKFSYNADNDPMFQQALASAMKSGKTAMQDTMGQAAALTGGYGSSYATGVGQNAYNQYVQEAYNMLPEYYQLALDAYEREGQRMLNQLSMMDNADSKEYDRLYNAYNMNYNSAQNMYNQEYGAWQDKVNNAYNYAGLLNSDYWNQMDYNESVRQYDQNFGYQQYLDSLNQSNWQNEFNYQQYADQIAQNQWASEFDYKKYMDSVTQNNWQNEFGYMQYRDDINQGNVEWEQGFKESESNRDQGNIEWEQGFKQNESNRDQSNIEWEQGFKQDESARDQSNIEWEQNFTKDEANRDQSNIDWEHGFKESEVDRDQSNIEWEQNFTQNESNRDQSNWEKEYSQNVYEFDASLGEDKRQFDASFGEEQRQFNESLSEDQRQFNESLSFDKTQAAQDQANFEREVAIKESQTKSEEAQAAGESDYKTPTQKMYNEAMEAYEKGGETALNKYLETAPDYDVIALYDYATDYGTVGLEARTYTKTKDTTNWLWGTDKDDVVVDQYGNEYKIGDLPKSVRDRLTSLKEGESYDFSTGKKVTK